MAPFLEVQPAQYPVTGFGFVVLYEVYRAGLLVELALRVTFKKVSSFVSENPGFYNEDSLYFSFDTFMFISPLSV